MGAVALTNGDSSLGRMATAVVWSFGSSTGPTYVFRLKAAYAAPSPPPNGFRLELSQHDLIALAQEFIGAVRDQLVQRALQVELDATVGRSV